MNVMRQMKFTHMLKVYGRVNRVQRFILRKALWHLIHLCITILFCGSVLDVKPSFLTKLIVEVRSGDTEASISHAAIVSACWGLPMMRCFFSIHMFSLFLFSFITLKFNLY